MAKKNIQIREVIKPILKASFLLAKTTDRRLRNDIGLTVSQFRILLAIKHGGKGKSQKNIADFWQITEASVSRQINILEDQRLIFRKKQDGNKNELALALTKLGENKINRAIKILDELFEDIFSDFQFNQRERMILDLTDFLNLFQKYVR